MYALFLKLVKENQKITTCHALDLIEDTRVLTDYAQKYSPAIASCDKKIEYLVIFFFFYFGSALMPALYIS
jgi:hypothetical protein